MFSSILRLKNDIFIFILTKGDRKKGLNKGGEQLLTGPKPAEPEMASPVMLLTRAKAG